MAIFEGVCERVFGRTFALQSYPEYLDFFRRCAVPWVPDFLHAPIDQGSSSGPPLDFGPASRSPAAVTPVSPPPSPGRFPWGGPRRFTMAMAGCPTLPATSSPPRPCAPVVERPADGRRDDGLHLWRLLARHFRGARAPRPDGGGPPGRSLTSTSSPLGWARSLRATLGPSRFQCPREPLA